MIARPVASKIFIASVALVVICTVSLQNGQRFSSIRGNDPSARNLQRTLAASPTMKETDIIYKFDYQKMSPYVLEEYNTIFFHVAKVASTEWLRLFTRMNGNPLWCEHNIHPQSRSKLKRLSDFSLKEAEDMMKDPKWTKAIFVRNPKERILSAFLDKSVAHKKNFEKTSCTKYARLGGDREECIEKHQDYGYFVKNIISTYWSNIHWRPTYTRVDEKWWPYINFVGNMESFSQDTKDFLSLIKSNVDGKSAWEKWGKTGWSNNQGDGCASAIGDQPFMSAGVVNPHHSTGSHDKLKTYYTPEIEKMIEKLYKDDLMNAYFEFVPLELFPHESKDDDYYS